jgi:hypothetical protein
MNESRDESLAVHHRSDVSIACHRSSLLLGLLLRRDHYLHYTVVRTVVFLACTSTVVPLFIPFLHRARHEAHSAAVVEALIEMVNAHCLLSISTLLNTTVL